MVSSHLIDSVPDMTAMSTMSSPSVFLQSSPSPRPSLEELRAIHALCEDSDLKIGWQPWFH